MRDDDGAVTNRRTGEAGGGTDGPITRDFQDSARCVEVITLLRSLLRSSRRAKSEGFRGGIRIGREVMTS